MVTAFRVGGQVVNGTAGTSVVVPNGGASGGDQLIAFISCVGAPTITPPAGWTLIQSVASGSNVTLAAYRKLAGAEGASWTWTLGASQRNWGWVGAYSGVDPSNPVTDVDTETALSGGVTILPGGPTNLADGGLGVGAAAAIRTASGTVTTWTRNDDERADLSTNAGTGTDICGSVGDGEGFNAANPLLYAPTLTASQSQTFAAAIAVTLNPYFVPLDPSQPLDILVEAAFGADPDSDLTAANWTDISAAVRANVRLRKGVLNENGQSDPTRIDFEINNPTGDFTPDNPQSIYWPNIVLDTPIRVSVQGFGVGHPYERATAFVDSWAPSWDDGPSWSVVTVSCGGRLQRLQEGKPPIRSAAFRTIVGNNPRPLDYWPLEDESGASAGSNAITGGKQAAVSGGASFAADTALPGSTGVVQLPTGAKVIGTVRRYAATGQWVVVAAVRLPVSVTNTTTLLEAFGSGTARRWRLVMVPGSPDQFRIRAYDSSETQILDNGFLITESGVYGRFVFLALGVTQNGANIDYQSWLITPGNGPGGGGQSGTLNANTNGNLRWASVTANADLDGMGVGHLAAFVDPAFDPFNGPVLLSLATLSGNGGESTWGRFVRLCNEEDIPFTVEQASSSIYDWSLQTMGPQKAGPFVGVLREAEARDAGIVHDGGPLGGLVFSRANRRYNRAVGLTLTGSQLMADFKPRFDTQARKGEVTASRPDGASYVFSPGSAGSQDSISANVEADSQLPSVASWRSAKGRSTGMRYPTFGIDLRANPELVRAWLASGISTRVNITQLPPQHPTTTVDLFIDGYAEEFDALRWVVNPINCSPARPQGEVFQLESTTGNRGRLDTAGSKVATDATTSATTLVVVTTQGPRWLPGGSGFDIGIGGEQVRVTNVVDSITDQFNRSGSSGWGTTDLGQTWAHTSTLADYSVTGTVGRIATVTINQLYLSTVDTGSDNHRVIVFETLPVVPTGAAFTLRAVGRFTDASNFYNATVTIVPGGAVSLQLTKNVAGVGSVIVSAVSVGTHAAGDQWKVILDVDGTAVRAKAWNATTGSDPDFWVVSATDADLPTGTRAGCGVRRETGNTNGTQNVDFNNFQIENMQTLTVQRGINNVSKPHSAGEPVSLWQPSVWAL